MMHTVCHEIKKDLRSIMPCILVLGITYTFMYYFYDTFCPIRMFTGFPCPGCGLTRAGVSVLLLQWKTAWKLNPTIFLWMPCICLAIFSRYFWKKGKKAVLSLFAIISIITVGCFIYRLKMYYPNMEPLNYHNHNVMLQLYRLKNF